MSEAPLEVFSYHQGSISRVSVTNVTINSGPSQLQLVAALNDVLLPHVADQALHNVSLDRESNTVRIPRCAEETRVRIRGDISDWIHGSDGEGVSSARVLWLTGPAGAGKTAIAASMADYCDSYPKRILAGCFFFSSRRTQKTRSKDYLITTLAFQIYRHEGLQAAASLALKRIQGDPHIFRQSLQRQLDTLILGPLRDSQPQDELLPLPQVIIIDGLDEVGSGPSHRVKEQGEILSTLLKAAKDPYFPFRLLISSRPEDNIRNTMSSASHIVNQVFLDEKYNPQDDIKIVLKSEFRSIQLSYHSVEHISDENWPGEDVIDELAANSSGQFAYPAAILRFVEHDYPGTDMYRRLDLVRSWRPNSDSDPTKHGLKPFEHLDHLYTGIIKSCHTGSVEEKVKWLRAINRRPGLPALFWRKFLASTEHDQWTALQGLNSLIYIPPKNDHDSSYGFYHKSLIDFLEDSSRSRGLGLSPGFENDLVEFLQLRFIAALQTYGPSAASVPSEQSQHFVPHFLSAIESICPSFNERHFCNKAALAVCDMRHWATQVVDQVAENKSKPSIIAQWFQFIHSQCPWHRCTRACKSWRTGILHACEEKGWTVPNVWVLLRNRFVHEIVVGGVVVGYPRDDHFSPPTHREGLERSLSA